MVLLTNPQTADLQQRIQNSSFGSPDYLQGFTGTVPGYQQNLLANNFQPGLITRDFSGGATSMNPSGVANYLSYTPGVPPQAVNNNTMLPIVPMVNAAVRQGGGGGGRDGQDSQGPSTEFVGNRGYRIGVDGEVTQLDPESMDYTFAKFMNTIISNSLLGNLTDPMSKRLDPDVMKQIQAFESKNPNSLTYGEGIDQSVNEVFGSNLQGGLTTNNPTGAYNNITPTGLNKPVNVSMNPVGSLSLNTTPTSVADLIGMTQGLQTGGGNQNNNNTSGGSSSGISDSQKKSGGGTGPRGPSGQGAMGDSQRQSGGSTGGSSTGGSKTGSRGAGGAGGRQKGGKQSDVGSSGDHRSGMGGGW